MILDLPVLETEVLPSIDAEQEIGEKLLSDSPWHVVLLDDDYHTYDYVVEMLMSVFGYSVEKAFQMAIEVDSRKRVIVVTCHLERAEAFQAEIHDYGTIGGWRVPRAP